MGVSHFLRQKAVLEFVFGASLASSCLPYISRIVVDVTWDGFGFHIGMGWGDKGWQGM